jgi:large subunit ribosomal protein L13
MKCFLAKPQEVERQWLLVDATDLVLGRMSARVAAFLRGKHKPTFTPNVDTGDHVIIINADKVRVTANKLETKVRYTHSGIPGGFKITTFGAQMAKDPADAVRRVVKGMLPHNALGRQMARKLQVYAGNAHPHAAQMPVDVTESFRQYSSPVVEEA